MFNRYSIFSRRIIECQIFLIFVSSLPVIAENSTDYTCPDVTSSNQSFCINSNPTVSDLQPSDALWYSSNDSSAVPLSGNTILTDDMTYYAVDQSETCLERIEVNVKLSEQVYAGNDAIRCFSNRQIDDMVDDVGDVRPIYLDMLDAGVPHNGTLNPTPAEIVAKYYREGKYDDFTTTYTVGDPGCQDSVNLTLRIQHENSAGENASITLFNNDSPINMIDILNGNPSKGGTWSILGDGVFDPAVDPEGDYVYTVDGCTGLDSSTVSVEVLPPGCPTVSDKVQSFCRSSLSGNKISDLVGTDNGGGIAWYIDNSSNSALSPDADIEDGEIYYVGSLDGNSCVGERLAVTVNLLDTPNAGKTTFLSFNSNASTVHLRDLLEQTKPGWPVDSGGFMTPDTNAGGTIFTPSIDGNWTGERQFTHTVLGSTECPDDEATVNITINPRPNNGHGLVFLGTNELDAQNYLENNDMDAGDELMVNIWLSTQLEINSVYRINIHDEDRYCYVNRLYSDPQYNPDLTLTSDTELEQDLSIEISSSTLQQVTDFGNTTSYRLDLQGGITIKNEQLLLDGSTKNSSYPLSVMANTDGAALNMLDGKLVQSNTKNGLETKYSYKGGGLLEYLTTALNSELNLLISDAKRSQLLSLELNDATISIGSRDVGRYYSVRQELDSLSGSSIDIEFEENGITSLSFGSDTTMVFTGQLQLGDSTATGYDIVVGGAMISESMVMKLESTWPDYVFSEEYKLPSLASIQAYIEEHKHLPGLPSAKNVDQTGLNIAETNRILLEKVEELTLHLLELKNEINAINIQNAKLNWEINK